MSLRDLENKLNALKVTEEMEIELETNGVPVFEKQGGSGINLDLTMLGGSILVQIRFNRKKLSVKNKK